MAIVHADDFEIYGRNTAYMTNGVYAQISDATLVADPDGVTPGTVLRIQRGSSSGQRGFIRKVLPTSANTVGVAARYWLSRIPAAAGTKPAFVVFKSAANVALFTVYADTTGRIVAVQGGFGGAEIGRSANPVITANAWYHVEIKIVIHPTEGSLEVRVEGRTVLNIENFNTGSTSIAQLTSPEHQVDAFDVAEQFLKDLVIWDGSGSQNIDFQGTVLLQGLDIVADVDLNWAPVGEATGYEILSTKPPVNSKYISAIDPPPPAYVGSMSQLPDDVTSVKGLVTYIRAAKIDGGDASLQVGLISSPDDTPETVEGADRPITVAQTYWLDVFEQDPKTLAPWTPQAVNTANFKINRTT